MNVLVHGYGWQIRWQIKKGPKVNLPKPLISLVGREGFEPTTSCV